MNLEEVTIRPLNDYYIDNSNNVVHLIAAIQYKDNKVCPTIYLVESNKKPLYTITSKDIFFFQKHKKVSMLHAKLLW